MLATLLFCALAQPEAVLHRQSVLHSEQGEILWSLGATYKMRFAADGASYLARVGRSLERSPELHFAFPGHARWDRSGNRVSCDRGSFREIYELDVNQVEQLFELDSAPPHAPLRFSIPVATTLSYVGRDEHGLSFRADPNITVRYSDATILDAVGQRVEVASEYDANGLSITIPQSFLANARWPIVIDPVIQTFVIDATPLDQDHPDVAHSSTTGNYVVVYEEIVSGSDTDIVSRRYSRDGISLDEVALDLSSVDSTAPRIACRTNQFLAAWHESTSLFSDSIIARARSATSSFADTAFVVTTSINGIGGIDVGATEASTSTPYFIVYQQGNGSSADLLARRVGSLGALSPITSVIDDSTEDGPPAITQSSGAGDRHLIVWAKNSNIHGRLFDSGGAAIGNSFQLSNSPFLDHAPDVAGDGIDFLAVWENIVPKVVVGNVSSVIGMRLRFGPGLSPLTSETNLSILEPGAVADINRTLPRVGSDGARYSIVYQQEGDIRMMTVGGDTAFTFFEGQVPIGSSISPERGPAICGAGFSDPGRLFVAKVRESLNSNDIDGAIVSTLGPGGITTVATGCGDALEPKLVISGVPALGNTLSFTITTTGSNLLALGPPTTIAACPGQASCAFGVLPLVLTPFPASFSTALPSDPNLVGATFGLQVLDLIPDSPASGVRCGAPKYSQAFRTSDTQVFTLQ